MIKKILLVTIITSILLAGCAKTSCNLSQQNVKMPSATAVTNSENTKSAAADARSASIDYNQYVKKTWIESQGINKLSFSISEIVNGKVTGRFSLNTPAVPFPGDVENLSGTVIKDSVEAQFWDNLGNKGNIKLVFMPNNQIKAAINLTEKSQSIEEIPQEGTFHFKPYNLKDIKGFTPIQNQSFWVNLNSWGNVRFVSGKLTAGNHIPVVFYLTNKEGDILYDFNATLPYSVDIKAVSFEDVSKDRLKDIIIIVADNEGSSPIATIYFQNKNGSFTNDPKLDQEINASGNNKDVKTIKSYLAQRF